MRKLPGLAIALVLVALTSGCAGRINKMMRSWEGHFTPELLAQWGPPQQVFADGRGGQVFIYTSTRAYTVPGNSTTQTSVNGTISGNQFAGTATSRRGGDYSRRAKTYLGLRCKRLR